MAGKSQRSAISFLERRYTSQDGLSLYFREYGDALAPGIPVLGLAGLSRNSKDFHDLATRLSKGRRVICPDYRGRGRSDYDANWRNYQPVTYINDIKHLVALTGLHRAVIIGASMGGLLAMGMAVVAPTVVAGAIINDVGPDPDVSGVARIIDYVGTDRPQPDREAAAAMLKEAMQELNLGSHEEWLKLADQTFRTGEDGLLHFDWDTNLAKPFEHGQGSPFDLWALFGALRPIPALVIRGGLSDVLKPATLERMKAEKPDLKTLIIPNKGHAPSLAEPQSLEAIDTFLAQFDDE